MKITKVRVSYSELVSTGNFKNKKIGCELEAEVGIDETYPTLREFLYHRCKDFVKEKISDNDSITISKAAHDKYCEFLKIANDVTAVGDLPILNRK